ncbi:MAG: hypothetical protein CL916_08095 [Deltaproteobacteria bacterium]|nr:hypothetical protein [Deltaproteobacteria bacterium]
MKNHYELLGLGKGFTSEEIKRKYRERAKDLHPDRFTGNDISESDRQEAHQEMAAINEAYRVLSDPGLRTQYDHELDSAAQKNHSSSVSNPPSSKTYKKPHLTRILMAAIVGSVFVLIINNSKTPNKRNFRDEFHTAQTVFKPQVDQALKGNLPSLKETMEQPEGLLLKRALSPELSPENCLNAFPNQLRAK